MAFVEHSAENLGLTVSEIFSGYRFTVYGMNGIHIEGHRGVLSVSDTEIVLKQKKNTIKVRGRNLTLKEITDCDVLIRGEIEGVIMGERFQ
ncbi:MAG: YabP/YqfC family sporulation protein [Christensenellales bacterium]